ncbi:MAG: hypothetical protein ACRC64_02275 [Plesiomonas shigelloides]
MKLKAVAGLFLLASSYSVLAADGDIREVSILGTSDLHGHFVPWDYAADQANLGDDSNLVVMVDCQIPADDLIVHFF